MKLQVKSGLIITGTLLIGMILGGLLSGMIRSHFHEKWAEGPRHDRFGRMINRIIEPDKTQAAKIQKIVDRYAPKFADQHKRHTGEMQKLVDSLNVELEPILTEEQMTRLKERLEHFSRRFGGRGKKGRVRGSPPPEDSL